MSLFTVADRSTQIGHTGAPRRKGEATMDFDLAIRGGTLADGTGRPAVRGDLGIKDGRIAAVGEVSGRATQTLDAGGLVVAPRLIGTPPHHRPAGLGGPVG